MKKIAYSALFVASGLIVNTLLPKAPHALVPARNVASDRVSIADAGLKIPFFYSVPKSSLLDVSVTAIAPDQIIDAVHSDSVSATNPLGLRIYKAGSRKGVGERLAKSGFMHTGDVILTFRPQWGGAGPYADVQMGISHTGMSLVVDDKLYNVDNPLSAEYLDPKGNLSSPHYSDTRYLHIVRPRLSETEKTNVTKWATNLFQSTFPAPGSKIKRIYQESLEFNQNYGDPRIIKDKQLGFVRDLGRMVLKAKGNQMPSSSQMMFCSEFVWAIFAMRGCDMDDASVIAQFQGSTIPSCIKPIFAPLPVTGTLAVNHDLKSGTIGLGEGPLAIIDSMEVSGEKRDALVSAVFPPARESELPGSVMSVGHKGVAKAMGDGGLFKALDMYYRAVASNPDQAKGLADRIVSATPANYSPASYLLNTLLPVDNENRAFDYVGTLDLGN